MFSMGTKKSVVLNDFERSIDFRRALSLRVAELLVLLFGQYTARKANLRLLESSDKFRRIPYDWQPYAPALCIAKNRYFDSSRCSLTV